MKNIVAGYLVLCGVLLIQSAPAEAFQGLTLLAVIVAIATALFLSAARRAMRKPSQQYRYYTRADYPPAQNKTPPNPASDALDNWDYNRANRARINGNRAQAAAIEKMKKELAAKKAKEANALEPYRKGGWDV